MEHFYESIEGWFTYPLLYKDMVTRFPSGSHFVEVGTYAGRSLAYLIVEIINAEKDIKVTAIDSFIGFDPSVYLQGRDLSDKFYANMYPIKDKFNVLVGNSWDAATKFDDNSLDFVFIDADHKYQSVVNDILAWMPKVKIGGVLAGHDYPSYPGVVKAVNEIFGDKFDRSYIDESVWLINM